MLFNSIDFAIFLPIVFTIFWVFQSNGIRTQNLILLGASYLFYGWWDWRFLSLIILSSLLDFYLAKEMHHRQDEKRRKHLLWCSLAFNLGMLGLFKYFNFFIENFVTAFQFFGQDIGSGSLSIILPVGISFYTFQTLSYSIDVYRKKIKPTDDLVAFSTFVAFFPQLVAGPIERASNLLPQFSKIKKFKYLAAADGCRQILWGFFKKLVIADNCAGYVNIIFENSHELTGSILVIGAILFAFQIYCDFSGYSDIAIGIARLFGFNLKQNFAFPYFSRNVGEFWRRWHISLSTWFRDYLYIPLGGSKNKPFRNILIVFLLSGLWHGANWTFIIWGALNVLLFLPSFYLNKNRKYTGGIAENKWLPGPKETISIILTFTLITFTWIFFRAESLEQAFQYINNMANWNQDSFRFIPPYANIFNYLTTLFFIVVLIIFEWFNRNKKHGLMLTDGKVINWIYYIFIASSIIIYTGDSRDFIYFQF